MEIIGLLLSAGLTKIPNTEIIETFERKRLTHVIDSPNNLEKKPVVIPLIIISFQIWIIPTLYLEI